LQREHSSDIKCPRLQTSSTFLSLVPTTKISAWDVSECVNWCITMVCYHPIITREKTHTKMQKRPLQIRRPTSLCVQRCTIWKQ